MASLWIVVVRLLLLLLLLFAAAAAAAALSMCSGSSVIIRQWDDPERIPKKSRKNHPGGWNRPDALDAIGGSAIGCLDVDVIAPTRLRAGSLGLGAGGATDAQLFAILPAGRTWLTDPFTMNNIEEVPSSSRRCFQNVKRSSIRKVLHPSIWESWKILKNPEKSWKIPKFAENWKRRSNKIGESDLIEWKDRRRLKNPLKISANPQKNLTMYLKNPVKSANLGWKMRKIGESDLMEWNDRRVLKNPLKILTNPEKNLKMSLKNREKSWKNVELS